MRTWMQNFWSQTGDELIIFFYNGRCQLIKVDTEEELICEGSYEKCFNQAQIWLREARKAIVG